MSQFLRPDGDVSSTNIASGTYAAIDETTASDVDYIKTVSLSTTGTTTATYECSLGNPSGTPGSGTTTIRYRGWEDKSPGITTLICELYEGATLRATDTTRTLVTTATTYEFNPDTSAVSNWDNLNLKFTFTAASSSASAGLLSWVELEAPNASVTATLAYTEAQDTFAATATHGVGGSLTATETQDTFASTATIALIATLAATEAQDTFAGTNLIPLPTGGSPYICERCGFEYPFSELKKEWTGLWVCRKDYDPKPPKLSPPSIVPEGIPRIPSRYPNPNNEPNTTTRADL